jgi:hypothetical protein
MKALAYLVLAVLGVLALASTPRIARACSGCVGDAEVRTIWPHEAADDVSVQAPIVITHVNTSIRDARLEASDGTVVMLVSKGLLYGAEGDCSTREFLAPVQPLAPSTTYTLKVEVNTAQEQTGPLIETRSFTTRADTETPEVEAHEPLKVESFYIEQGPPCEAPKNSAGHDALDVYVTVKSSSRFPTWVRLRTAPHASGLIDYSGGAARLVAFSRDECVTYERIDVRGEVVEQGSLCEPKKCTRSNSLHLGGTCSFYGLDLDPWSREQVWDAVADDSCSAPPSVVRDENDGTLKVRSLQCTPDEEEPDSGGSTSDTDADAGPGDSGSEDAEGQGADDSKPGSGSSCAIGRDRDASWIWLGVAMLGVLHRSRRASAKRRS